MIGRMLWLSLIFGGNRLVKRRYRKGSGGVYTRKTVFFIAMISILGFFLAIGIPILLSSFEATCGLVDKFVAGLAESNEIADTLLHLMGADNLGC